MPKRQVYTVEVEIPLTDLEDLYGVSIGSATLADRLLDAIREWALDNPDVLRGAFYTLVETDDETGEETESDGRLK